MFSYTMGYNINGHIRHVLAIYDIYFWIYHDKLKNYESSYKIEEIHEENWTLSH